MDRPTICLVHVFVLKDQNINLTFCSPSYKEIVIYRIVLKTAFHGNRNEKLYDFMVFISIVLNKYKRI